jgi:outer membrane protein OmpA-like peptidoglycan-associated protein
MCKTIAITGKTTLILAIALGTTACQTMSEHRTGTGAATGAAVGGGAGALIDKDNPYRGALIGAAAGALIGAGVGHVLQKQKEALDRIEGLETREQTVILQQPPTYDEGGQSTPRQSRQQEALMVRVPNEILFEVGSSALSAHGSAKLREVAAVLREYPDSDVYIRGCTSSEGSDQTNFELSQRRAQVVKNELIAAGVSPARLFAQGMGSSNPIASNDTESGRMLNRRVELHIVPRA